jgi:hypothetical protein
MILQEQQNWLVFVCAITLVLNWPQQFAIQQMLMFSFWQQTADR